MGGVVWIGFAAFFVGSSIVGVRLLLLWRRTRQLPELLIGLGVLGIGPVGFGLMVVSQLLATEHPLAGRIGFATAFLAVSGGALAKYLFNWKVYHPNSPWMRRLVYLCGAALLANYLADLVLTGFENPAQPSPSYFTRSFLQQACLFWGSIEALRYWSKMRRRVSLGIADPLVANRFLCWGVGAGAAAVGSAVGTVAQMATGVGMLEMPWVTLSSSAHGLIAAIAIWLAFLPPAAYRRRFATAS